MNTPASTTTRMRYLSFLPSSFIDEARQLAGTIKKKYDPAGDYVRQMTWPIVEGVSLMHLHISRGKRSLVLDLKLPAERTTVYAVKNAELALRCGYTGVASAGAATRVSSASSDGVSHGPPGRR